MIHRKQWFCTYFWLRLIVFKKNMQFLEKKLKQHHFGRELLVKFFLLFLLSIWVNFVFENLRLFVHCYGHKWFYSQKDNTHAVFTIYVLTEFYVWLLLISQGQHMDKIWIFIVHICDFLDLFYNFAKAPTL